MSLRDLLLHTHLPESTIRERIASIQRELLAQSQHLRVENFTAIHTRDAEVLFDAYDQRFFSGHCRASLQGRPLRFRLAPRMTKAGGKTFKYVTRSGEFFEIAIGTSILFDGFRETDPDVTVCGVRCAHRLDALQRIFEHEIVHLAELLCWERSACSEARFQDIAARFFQHRSHTHAMLTRRQRAAHAGFVVGARVQFAFEGRTLAGRLNRVTKRATVLVEDPAGQLHSDGRRYARFYVPLAGLSLVETS